MLYDRHLQRFGETGIPESGVRVMLAQNDGRFIVAGGFDSIQGVPFSGLARLYFEAPAGPPHIVWQPQATAVRRHGVTQLKVQAASVETALPMEIERR
jgi:hypothetical protein